MSPSSSFALSLKPSVANLCLNFCAGWKKQTTLPSLAYAGIPYHVRGEMSGEAAFAMAWIRSAIVRSVPGDLREHLALAVRLLGARLRLSRALLHGGALLVREPRGRPAGGAPGRLLLVLHLRASSRGALT